MYPPTRFLHTRNLLFVLSFSLLLGGCGGVQIQSGEVDDFAAGQYRYYAWRSEPLPQNTHTSDPFYAVDPVVRREVDAHLQALGYQLDPQRHQFSVDYVFAEGVLEGEEPEQASNISHTPSATINRQVDQASVDNAIALGGVKATNTILVHFHDIASGDVVWTARLTKIIENANSDAAEELAGPIARIFRDLPPAPTP